MWSAWVEEGGSGGGVGLLLLPADADREIERARIGRAQALGRGTAAGARSASEQADDAVEWGNFCGGPHVSQQLAQMLSSELVTIKRSSFLLPSTYI